MVILFDCRRQKAGRTSCGCVGARQWSQCLYALQKNSIHNACTKGEPIWKFHCKVIREDRTNMTNNVKIFLFYFFNQHHCRSCGAVVCGPCSSKKFLLPQQSTKPLRVCLDCYDSLSQTKNEGVGWNEIRNAAKWFNLTRISYISFLTDEGRSGGWQD